MNSGKSTQLLQIANNYESMGKTVALFTSAMDDRYGFGKITSRLNLQRDARTFSPELNFLAEDFGQTACILIDEAQFITPEQVHQLHELAHTRNIPVICFGLRTDFRGEPFVGSGMLLALADEIEEIKTICECGKKPPCTSASMPTAIASRKARKWKSAATPATARFAPAASINSEAAPLRRNPPAPAGFTPADCGPQKTCPGV